MKKLCIIGFIFVSLVGTLFHFLYDYVPIFIFPKNESIFEHTKLIIIPMLIYYLIVIMFKFDKVKLFCLFVKAILIGILVVVSCYYTYSGMLGYNVDFINIIIYFISVLAMFIVIYKEKTLFDFTNSVVVLIIILLAMIIFTYYPIDIAFFN